MMNKRYAIRCLALVLAASLGGCAGPASVVPEGTAPAEGAAAPPPVGSEKVVVEQGATVAEPPPVGSNIRKRNRYRRGGSSYSIKVIGRQQVEEQGGATAEDILKPRGD